MSIFWLFLFMWLGVSLGTIVVMAEDEWKARDRKKQRKSLEHKFSEMDKTEALRHICDEFQLDLASLRLSTEGELPAGTRPSTSNLRQQISALLLQLEEAISVEARRLHIAEEIGTKLRNLSREFAQASENDAYAYKSALHRIELVRGCPAETIAAAYKLAAAGHYEELMDLIRKFLPGRVFGTYSHPY